MTRRSPTQRRFTAAALMALWVALPLGTLLHASHEHQLCLEHGVLEESSSAPANATPMAEGDASDHARLHVAPMAEGHQLCSVLAALHRPVEQVQVAELLLPAVEATAVTALSLRDAVAQIPLLDRAPKLSPPHA